MRKINKHRLWILPLLEISLGTFSRADSSANSNSCSTAQACEAPAASSLPPAVLGVRGLEEEKSGAVDTQVRDYATVDKLDLVKISDDELKKFIQDGNLK